MRVACSCAGEGLGHAARLVVMGPRLAAHHEVRYYVPQTVRPFLERKLPGFSCRIIPGLTFAKRRDRVDLARTVLENLPLLFRFPLIVRRLARWLKRDGIQAVISDFDPFLAWAGWSLGLPVFQYNHPGIVSDCMTWEPVSWAHALAAKFLEGPWTKRAHISFYQSTIGPLYRASLFRHPVSQGQHFVVNLTKESYRRPLLSYLQLNHPELDIRVFPDPASDFEQSLASCQAVISSAGHQMIAESLALGKPILALPQRGQWEQVLNARRLEATGRGMASCFRDLGRDFPRFLARLDAMAAADTPLPAGYRINDGTQRLTDRILAFLDGLTKATPEPHHGLMPMHQGVPHVAFVSSFGQTSLPPADPETGKPWVSCPVKPTGPAAPDHQRHLALASLVHRAGAGPHGNRSAGMGAV